MKLSPPIEIPPFFSHDTPIDVDIEHIDALTQDYFEPVRTPIHQNPDINLWRERFTQHSLPSIKQEIDTFIEKYGVNYMFVKDDSPICLFSVQRFSSHPVELGTLLHIAAEHAKDINILQYLVEDKQADVNLPMHKTWLPLRSAISAHHFEHALYLLEQGTELKDEPFAYKNILDAACVRGDQPKSPVPEDQLTLIRALLKRGQYLPSEQYIKNDRNIDLAALRQEILTNHPYFRQKGNQLIDPTQELMDAVALLLKIQGHTAFYCMEAIQPSETINEHTLSVFIQALENRKTPLADLVCGLLLEGYIENTMPDRAMDTEQYMEKRTQDACMFYTKAARDGKLKPVTDILLWQQKTQGPESVYTRLKQYDISSPTAIMPSCDDFAQPSITMPLYNAF
ncbi:MAG: hypothetical protein P1U36_08420 [Legionellaceae bacterium]|nr:hypothetical protein [Legionellaceae bacterium]